MIVLKMILVGVIGEKMISSAEERNFGVGDMEEVSTLRNVQHTIQPMKSALRLKYPEDSVSPMPNTSVQNVDEVFVPVV